MTKKLILLLTTVFGTLGFVVFRAYLIANCIDLKIVSRGDGPQILDTGGFYKADAGLVPTIFAFALAALVVFVLIFVFFVDKTYPGSPRLTSPTIITLNFAYAAFLIVYSAILLGDHSQNNTALVLMVIALAGYMAYYSICMIMKRLPIAFVSIVPTIVFCYKLLIEFLDSFSIIKTAEVLIDLASLVCTLLFFTYFARYTSKTKFRASRKAFVAFGALSVILLCVNVLPYGIASFAAGANPVRAYPDNDAALLIATAFYIFVYVTVSLAKPQLYRSEKIHGIDAKTGRIKDTEHKEYVSERLELE